jgi:UDP-2,3-diacylglucosamine pyrophosphatase LpxH
MTSSTSSRSSLLIVSDLHLGGALRPPLNFTALKMVARLDQAFERFIDYHLAHPLLDDVGDPAPWNLIFNGDTIDFLHMGLSAQDQLNLEEEETLYGLSFARRRSRWKLQGIARYHRRTFRALCRFLEAGNECVFVIGNYDVDLWFE